MENLIATVISSILLASCASHPTTPESHYAPVNPTLGDTLHDRGIYLLARPAASFSRMT